MHRQRHQINTPHFQSDGFEKISAQLKRDSSPRGSDEDTQNSETIEEIAQATAQRAVEQLLIHLKTETSSPAEISVWEENTTKDLAAIIQSRLQWGYLNLTLKTTQTSA